MVIWMGFFFRIFFMKILVGSLKEIFKGIMMGIRVEIIKGFFMGIFMEFLCVFLWEL